MVLLQLYTFNWEILYKKGETSLPRYICVCILLIKTCLGFVDRIWTVRLWAQRFMFYYQEYIFTRQSIDWVWTCNNRLMILNINLIFASQIYMWDPDELEEGEGERDRENKRKKGKTWINCIHKCVGVINKTGLKIIKI